VERIESDPVYAPDDAEPLEAPSEAAFKRFVSSTADGQGRFVIRSGAPVAFLTATGHLLADAYDIRDVVPYTGRSVFTEDQLDQALERLHAAGGNTVLVPMLILERVAAALDRRGFEVLTSSGYRPGVPGESIPAETLVTHSAYIYPDELTKWVDRRALHPSTAGASG
jgi:hypothetical protein